MRQTESTVKEATESILVQQALDKSWDYIGYRELTEELRVSLQKWYNADRGESIIRELSGLLALE
jgi:hypothetical protein